MNKPQECAIVEAFIKFSGIPDLGLHECGREKPDALIASEGGLIGVEVTVLSEETPREAVNTHKWRAEGSRLLEATRRAFEAKNQAQVIVNIAMRSDWKPPNRKASAQFALDLAHLVDQTLVSPPAWPRNVEPYELHDPHPDVEWIYIARSTSSSYWAPSIAGETHFASAEDIGHTIARKESLVEIYRQAAPKTWLLIDCDVFGQGVALDVPRSPFQVPTAFDRVFCCGFAGWRWTEIAVDKSSGLTAG
jgi:hypothetical protein